MKKALTTFIFLVCIGTFCFSGWKLYEILSEYKNGTDIYHSVLDEVTVPVLTDSSTPSDSADSPEMAQVQLINLDALKQINPDAAAWITIPDTNISYPVLTPDDNYTYLRTTINGKQNKAGCIFVDCRTENPFANANTIIYGHNLLNGAMFCELTNYEKENWRAGHPLIYLQTENGLDTYRVFSCYKTTDDSATYNYNLQLNTDEYQNYLHMILNHSLFKSDISPSAAEPIITLSTCTNDDEHERFIVHAVKNNT